MISVITPSVRPNGLEIVEKCLKKQTIKDFEWIVVTPKKLVNEIHVVCRLLTDPPKKPGDFWTLCKAWNKAYAHARGELIVNIQDFIWFPPDTLERFWQHYMDNPKSLVSTVGNHYKKLDELGKPVEEVWRDPRMRMDQGSFYKVDNTEMEMSMCSVPKKAILDCGGIDEEYDKGPGVQEKEMCLRLQVLGYEMYLDQLMEYRALEHGRLKKNWNEKYWKVIAPLYVKHIKELTNIKRPLNVGNIEKYLH